MSSAPEAAAQGLRHRWVDAGFTACE